MNQTIYVSPIQYVNFLFVLSCGVAIVALFRGSPSAILGGIAFGIFLALSSVALKVQQLFGVYYATEWYGFIRLAAWALLLTALLTGRARRQSDAFSRYLNASGRPLQSKAVGRATQEEGDTLISQLSGMPTIGFILLSTLTGGLYLAYKIRRQSRVINSAVGDDNAVSRSLTRSVIFLILLSSAIFVFEIFKASDYSYQFSDLSEVLDALSPILNISAGLLLIFWAFKARGCIHDVLSTDLAPNKWFSGVGTFFFTIAYINYKSNKLSKAIPFRYVSCEMCNACLLAPKELYGQSAECGECGEMLTL